MNQKTLIIGAGGVGNVVAQKCARLPEVFSELCLASRTLSKCDAIAADCEREISTAKVDADKKEELIALIKDFGAGLVINVALPYQDLTIMDACLETGVHYLDTACYEAPEEARFSYVPQWAYHDRFAEAGIMGLLGCGFDPGVTSVFVAHALKHHLDSIQRLDILDCNGGDHGHPFATNFNPEINIREVTQNGKFFDNGQWVETKPFEYSVDYDFGQGIGTKRLYLIYHEELETLARNISGVERMRFFMTFSDNYLKHLEVLQNVGMTRIDPVVYEGKEIIPLRFLKAVLPEPGSLGAVTRGKTWIGCEFHGTKNGASKSLRVFNQCDHEECYADVKSQAVSFTTGVPAMIGAKMMLTGEWMKPGVFNVEQFDPDPFMRDLGEFGLPWQEDDFVALAI